MTVSSTQNRVSYVGNDVTTAFSTSPVIFFNQGDLDVYLVVTATGVATLQTITTHYTVSGGAGATGTVTMLIAPTSLQTLLIVRTMDLTQSVDFVQNDPSDAEVAEDALDKLTMVCQQLQEQMNRALQLALSSGVTNLTIPNPVANLFLKWNAAATALENADIGSLGAISLPVPVASGGTGATSAAAARTNLGAVGLTGNETVAGDKTLSGATTLSGGVSGATILNGITSPSQITATQNDYNPTGLSTTSVLRINSDARRSITGLAGGATGRTLQVHNVGTFPILFKFEDAGSSTGNRFTFGHTLSGGHTLSLIYDGTAPRWRCTYREDPAGTIKDFGGGTVPDGFLARDGSNVSRTTYAALFNEVGTTWGVGDGSTTFGVGDSRRRAKVGSGGSGSGTLGNAVGNTGGAETHTLITGELSSHSHGITDITTGGAGFLMDDVGSGGVASASTKSTNPWVSASAGSGTAHNNVQPSEIVTSIIKY